MGAFTNEIDFISSVNLVPGGPAVKVVYVIPSTVMTNVGQMEVVFTWTPVGTAGASDYFIVDDLDLRVVPTGLTAVNPVFERTDYQTDLLRCLRHFWGRNWNAGNQQYVAGFVTGMSQSATQMVVHQQLPTRMRRLPTMTLSSPAHCSASNCAASPIAFAALNILCPDTDIVQLQGTVSGGLGISGVSNGGGQAVFIYMSAASPTVAYCWISAEI